MSPDDLSELELEHDGRTVTVRGGAIVVGRSKDAGLRVVHPLVSREHCRFTLRAEGVFVEDLGSSNGTHLAGRRLDAPTRIQRGDTVTLGREGPALVLRRASLSGQDLLDEDDDKLATIMVGDPRAQDIAARVVVGGSAGPVAASERPTIESEPETRETDAPSVRAPAALPDRTIEAQPLDEGTEEVPSVAPGIDLGTMLPLTASALHAVESGEGAALLDALAATHQSPPSDPAYDDEIGSVAESDAATEPLARPPSRGSFWAGIAVGVVVGTLVVLGVGIALGLPERLAGGAR